MTTTGRDMLRVGRIRYINCYPVYGAIDRGIVPLAGELVDGVPTQLNRLMANGDIDISVVSAVEYAKDAVHRGSELPLRDGLRLEGDLNTLLATSADRAEGLAAFFAKRPADFAGR